MIALIKSAAQLTLVIHLLVFSNVLSSTHEDDRKVWSICTTQNGSTELTQSCKCGDDLHYAIVCNDHGKALQVQPCYCLHYELDNRTVAEQYSFFNKDMCSSLMNAIDTHREGRFCGRCKKGFGLAVYSYHYTSCIPCQHYSYKNWLKYFAISLLPVTLIYFVVVLLKISVTSSRTSGSVFALQCLLSPLQLRIFDGWVFVMKGGVHYKRLLSVFLGFIGIVNLDFLRDVYPYFCLHPKLSILHVVSLDFIVALYPFFLIFLTYVLVSLYDKNFRLLLWAWKPFKWCLQRYQRQLDVKGSLIETFATFILLSNVKILAVCFDLLLPTKAYDESGSQLKVKFLYYDANIEYFGSEHLPFAVLALFVGFVFVFLPFLLLLLYPCRCFQHLLNALGWRCQTLHIFMDAFQGSYRTNPHDLRYFSAYYLLLRFLILFTAAYTASVFYMSNVTFLVTLGVIVFAGIQPYKQLRHNWFDVVAMLLLLMFYTSLSSNLIASVLDQHWQVVSSRFMIVSLFLVLVIFFLPIVSFAVSSPKLSLIVARIRSTVCRRRKRQRRGSSTSLLIDTLEREP